MRVLGTKIGAFRKIAIFILGCLVLQSCWKDKTLKDRQSPKIDIEPTYGIPLVDYELTCKKLLEYFNDEYLYKKCSVHFYEDGLGYFLFDEFDTTFNVDLTKPMGEFNGQFSLFDFKDNNNGFFLQELNMLTYAENYTNASFNIYDASMALQLSNGSMQNFANSFDENGVIVANGSTNPLKTYLFSTNIKNPMMYLKGSTKGIYNIKARITSNSSEREGTLKIAPILHLPAWMIISNNMQQDTIDLNQNVASIFNYNTDSIADGQIKVKGFTLRLAFTNNFPIATKLQCVMMDSNYNVVGNLFSDYVTLEAASINSDYTIKNAVEKSINVEMNEGDDLYNQMLKTKYLVIQEIYNTNGQDVKLLKDNKLSVKANIVITAKAKGEINAIVNSLK